MSNAALLDRVAGDQGSLGAMNAWHIFDTARMWHGADDDDRASSVSDHFQTSADFTSSHEIPAEHRRLLEAGLNSARSAVVVCDGTSRVLVCNGTAKALLRRPDGISLKADRISIADGAARQRFLSILKGPSTASTEAALLVPRPSRQASYQMVLRPVGRASATSAASAWWSIAISDPDHIPAHSLRMIARLYGLTAAETRLAQHLMLGATVNEVATATGVSVCTIRSQLRSLLIKTGSRRQAELVRILSAVPV